MGTHPRITGFLGRSEHGLLLEPGVGLAQRLEMDSTREDKWQWARQTAERLGYLHSRGVLHCDLHPENLLLDVQGNTRLCDFQGTMGELDGAALERVRYCLPRPGLEPSTRSDNLTLGSNIFRTMTGRDPQHDLADADVQLEFEWLHFPPTDFPAGTQVQRCWRQEYSCVEEVIRELDDIAHRGMRSATYISCTWDHSSLYNLALSSTARCRLGPGAAFGRARDARLRCA